MAKVAKENWVEKIRDPKIECMSREEMKALQSEKLIKQVKNVYENVAFYRKKMDDAGVKPEDIKSIDDIVKLPFTTKEELRDNYPFGLLAVPQKDIVRVQGTSGTTGKLTLMSYTQKDVDVWGECVARALTMAGLTEEDRLHICYGYGLFTGGLGLDFGARALGCMSIPMSSGNTQRQLMCMEDFGATAFACTPSYALYLSEAAKEAGVVDSGGAGYICIIEGMIKLLNGESLSKDFTVSSSVAHSQKLDTTNEEWFAAVKEFAVANGFAELVVKEISEKVSEDAVEALTVIGKSKKKDTENYDVIEDFLF